MKKIIENVKFPGGNGATTFPSCFASVWMRSEGVNTEEQAKSAQLPGGKCCGRCGGNKLEVYHHSVQNWYTIVSGLTLVQLDIANEEHFNGWGINRVLAEYDDYIKFTMGFAGFLYERFDKSADKVAVFDSVKKSIDADRPALINLGTGYYWYVVIGYDDKDGTIYGLGDNSYWKDNCGVQKDGVLVSDQWYEHMAETVIVTGKTASTVTYDDVFRRMISILDTMDKTGYFQRSADYLKDDAKFEGYDNEKYLGLAKRIGHFLGLPVDSRDIGCPIKMLAQVEAFKDRAQYLKRIAAEYDHNCDVSWVAWDMVGSYKGEIEEPAKMLPYPLYRRAIANVIEVVIKNNRRVLDCLREMMGVDPSGK